MRQNDHVAHDRGAGVDHVRNAENRRSCGQRCRAEGSRHRDGFPELRAVSAHDGSGKPRLRTQAARRIERDHRRAREGIGRTARTRSVSGSSAARALGRAAPARCARPRAGAPSAGFSARRAVVESRCQIAPVHAPGNRAAASQRADHDDLRHARPDRGDDARPAHRRVQDRRDPADRHADEFVYEAAKCICGGIPRQSGDEFLPRQTRARRWSAVADAKTPCCRSEIRPDSMRTSTRI